MTVTSEGAPVNIGATVWPSESEAYAVVRRIQRKLHCWAGSDRARRFDDLYNLVCDPNVLIVAWERVAGNKGARTAGVDRATVAWIESRYGVHAFLHEVRRQLRTRTFTPAPVRRVMIPKASGKLRALGIPTVTDRVVQAALKIVLEPILEADFQPVSYGFRPNRRAQDAIAEIHHFTTQSYQWVLEADIEACFDNIDHTALMDRLRTRISDKRVLALVKSFLKAGVLTTAGTREGTITGTPQGGILSPLLANLALSVLDDHFVQQWQANDGERAAAAETPTPRPGELPARPLRRRLRRPGDRREGTRPGLARAGRGGPGPDGATTVAGEDPRGPHRRRLRLPRLHHPTDAKTRKPQALRLHPALDQGDRLDQGPGPDHDLQSTPCTTTRDT